jgi:CheY-like chemotaxis protein
MEPPASPLRPLRILVVEDNADVRDSLSLLLRLGGHDCEAAPTGPEAVRAAASFRADVVLMDIGLPGPMDGWQAAREMRRAPGLGPAVFVATTGHCRSVDVDRSAAEGFAAHLTKPYDPAELMAMLAALAAQRRAAGPGNFATATPPRGGKPRPADRGRPANPQPPTPGDPPATAAQ